MSIKKETVSVEVYRCNLCDQKINDDEHGVGFKYIGLLHDEIDKRPFKILPIAHAGLHACNRCINELSKERDI